MYTINFKEELDTIRVFESGDSYKKKSIPYFSCTCHYISDDEVYIGNARGNFSAVVYKLLTQALREKGIKLMRFERNGKMKNFNLDKKFPF